VEQGVPFFATLALFALTTSPRLAGVLGIAYSVGRMLYFPLYHQPTLLLALVTVPNYFEITGMLFASLYTTFLRPAKNLRSMGEWAVVTGATDGIGKAMSVELARKGLKVVLISRSEDKLQATKKEIEEKVKGATVATIQADFNDTSDKFYDNLKQKLRMYDIGVLVNNVGVAYPHPEYYAAVTEETITSMIAVNVTSVARLTHAVLPGMVERKRGAIVNVSSLAGVTTSPLLALYSGTKSFVDSFSKSVDAEYRRKGISIQSQVPLFVTSKLSKIQDKAASFFTPRPSVYARYAVAAIGHEVSTSPYPPHAFQQWIISLVPPRIAEYCTLQFHEGLRKRAHQKKAEAQK